MKQVKKDKPHNTKAPAKSGITNKVKWPIFVLCAFMLMSQVQPARAFLGFGDIVFDPSIFVQTIIGYITQISDYANQAEQLSNQMQSLYNEAKNLASMDGAAAYSTMASLRNSLSKMRDLQGKVRGITMNYQELEGEWGKIYEKDFQAYDGRSVKEYADAAGKTLEQTSNATYDAMRAQGLVAQIGDDAGNLDRLLDASQSSSGALAAAQAGNQIAGVNAQQLMRLQHIVAASYRAQSSFYAEQAQKEAMARADSKRFFGDRIERPLQGKGNGRATKQY